MAPHERSLTEFLSTYGAEIIRLTTEHLGLVAVSVFGAGLIGLPLGVSIHQHPRWKSAVLGMVNVFQTIPSLAFFALLIPLPLIGGIGKSTALIALVLYCLLPIVSNTVTGLNAVDPVLREAGIAMGMTSQQLLWRVELPLASGVILAGIRIATVTAVGLATIAAAIGAGGLGMFIFRGLAMLDTPLILAGAIPAALLALAADYLLLLVERRLGRQDLSRSWRGQ
jgi:osmoprotectant transport system permease protein